ncbi:hypothetical protein ElyMa_002175500 [Elysia marginata]|uniref:Uncharacterized protein n=1 Tax=Elysia marginata TaxID=1093978 RepID=A0AAV4FRT4_9GAST|nr:hypothetical protein ElyMa_002175500 [Elysia marginata]
MPTSNKQSLKKGDSGNESMSIPRANDQIQGVYGDDSKHSGKTSLGDLPKKDSGKGASLAIENTTSECCNTNAAERNGRENERGLNRDDSGNDSQIFNDNDVDTETNTQLFPKQHYQTAPPLKQGTVVSPVQGPILVQNGHLVPDDLTTTSASHRIAESDSQNLGIKNSPHKLLNGMLMQANPSNSLHNQIYQVNTTRSRSSPSSEPILEHPMAPVAQATEFLMTDTPSLSLASLMQDTKPPEKEIPRPFQVSLRVFDQMAEELFKARHSNKLLTQVYVESQGNCEALSEYCEERGVIISRLQAENTQLMQEKRRLEARVQRLEQENLSMNDHYQTQIKVLEEDLKKCKFQKEGLELRLVRCPSPAEFGLVMRGSSSSSSLLSGAAAGQDNPQSPQPLSLPISGDDQSDQVHMLNFLKY